MKQDTDISEGRRDLITSLQTYRSKFPEEHDVADRMLEFVIREHACFDRATEEGHLTGSAWIVHPSDGRVLLTHHRKLNKWLQLGGHADGVQDLLDVALTEAREESGISLFTVLDHEIYDIDIHLIPARKHEPEHFHFDVRYLLRASTEAYTVSDESHDLAWIETSMMSTLTTESSMIRMAEKWDGIKSRYISMRL
jgi:hypothetical protein